MSLQKNFYFNGISQLKEMHVTVQHLAFETSVADNVPYFTIFVLYIGKYN